MIASDFKREQERLRQLRVFPVIWHSQLNCLKQRNSIISGFKKTGFPDADKLSKMVRDAIRISDKEIPCLLLLPFARRNFFSQIRRPLPHREIVPAAEMNAGAVLMTHRQLWTVRNELSVVHLQTFLPSRSELRGGKRKLLSYFLRQ